MLDTLAAEIIVLILSNVTTVPDLLNLRLVSKSLAVYTVPRLFELAFKKIRLPLGDIDRLRHAAFHINHSQFAKNIRWIAIEDGDSNAAKLARAGRMIAVASEVEQSYELLSVILTCFATPPLAKTIEEITVDFGVRDFFEDSEQRIFSHNGTTYSSSVGQSSSNRSFEMLKQIYDSNTLLDILSCRTAKILNSWYLSQLYITTLELDGTVLALTEIGELAHFITALAGIRRLSLRLCESSIEPITVSVQDETQNARLLATALHDRLEQLVISSTCTTGEAWTQNSFLESFVEYAVFPKLQYLYLDGFSLACTVLLRFLERHKETLEQHGYSKFCFNDMDDLESEEFNVAFNHEMCIRGLSHLQISSFDSTSY